MKLMRLKRKSKKAPLGAQAAIAVGGLLLSWGYRRWSRRKTAVGTGRTPSEDAKAEAERLAGKFHSLDEDAHGGKIPKDLEREPKDLEQSIHPG